MGREYKNQYLWLVLIISILAAFLVQRPRLFDPYAVEEDFRSFSWMHLFQDPDLFKGQVLVRERLFEFDLNGRPYYIYEPSPGYSLLFTMGSYVIEPIFLSKLLIFPIILATVFYAFRIGSHIRGPGTGVGLGLAFTLLSLASSSAISAVGGFQRSFALPLLLAIVYCLMTSHYRKAAVVIVLSGLIYPPVFVIGTITYGLSLLSFTKAEKLTLDWKASVPLLLAAGLVIISLTPTIISLTDDTPTGLSNASSEEIPLLEDPRHQEGGRRQLFEFFPFIGRGAFVDSAIEFWHGTILLFLSIVIVVANRNAVGKFPNVFKNLLLASFLCFGMVWLAALITNSFILYLPSRYTRTSILVVLLIFVVVNAEETMAQLTHRIRQTGPNLVWYILPFGILGLILIAFFPADKESVVGRLVGQFRVIIIGLLITLFLLTWKVISRNKTATNQVSNITLPKKLSQRKWIVLGLILILFSIPYVAIFNPDFEVAKPAERALYKFIETLPKDALIAGNPCNLDGIPLFAKRSVLFSCETVHLDSDVMLDALTAYYSDSKEEVLAFCQRYDVDYLLVNPRTYERTFIAEGNYFFEPYNSQLSPALKAKYDFALRDIPVGNRLFDQGVFVMPCTDEALGIQKRDTQIAGE